MVLKSSTTLPGAIPSRTPFWPSTTSSTVAGTADQPQVARRVPVLPIDSPAALAAAVAALQQGELIAFPTDTLYGVGGNAPDALAARRTYDAKGRPAGKGFPVLLASAGDAL